MALENNRFYQNRHRIRAIAREKQVDVSTATRMLVKEMGWTGYHQEINEWDVECNKLQRGKNTSQKDMWE